jgi:hypothetical protein
MVMFAELNITDKNKSETQVLDLSNELKQATGHTKKN